ncbi:MAG: hypothetical protein AABY22_23095, partial [Nanoarchaeota archaeon]
MSDFFRQLIKLKNNKILKSFCNTLESLISKEAITISFNEDLDSEMLKYFFELSKNKLNRVGLFLDRLDSFNSESDYATFVNLLDENELFALAETLFENNDYKNQLIVCIFKSPVCDRNKLINVIIKEKKYYLAVEIINNPSIQKNEIDILVLQRFVESSGDEYLLSKLLDNETARDKKINFAGGKKKYNELYQKKNVGALPTAESFIESHRNKYNKESRFSPIAESFIKEVVDKKDWFFLNENTMKLFDNELIKTYFSIKNNKSGRDVYHEIKNDNIIVLKCSNIAKTIYQYRYEWSRIIENDFGEQLVDISSNFAHFIKIMEKTVKVADVMHKIGINPAVAKTIILNDSIDPGAPGIQDFLETYRSLS